MSSSYRFIFALGLASILVILFKIFVDRNVDQRALVYPEPQWERSSATDQEIALYEALLKRKVNVIPQYNDGHKTVDLAIPEAKLYIEVDGVAHCSKEKSAFTDLQRTYYSLKEGFVTLRIPNVLTEDKLNETADMIADLAKVRSE